MSSVTILVSFVFIPLLVFLVLVVFAEEKAKEVKKKLEEDPINMDKWHDYEAEEDYSWDDK
jgi:hypothetical protein|tara:strand:- start:2750 stop:2932 length:183 start_codon:yes stop_codon:yes gene_type:complete